MSRRVRAVIRRLEGRTALGSAAASLAMVLELIDSGEAEATPEDRARIEEALRGLQEAGGNG